MRTTGVIGLIGCFAISACDFGGDDTIFKEFSAQDGYSVSVDAHQRAIVATHVRDESGTLRTIYCAEPSPDAFASISRTITGSLSGSRGVDDEFAATLARSLATQASDALSARNATIQLLRDGLYRACEGYASGALTTLEYAEITKQYQHIMAALLSIELLSNINRPRRQSHTTSPRDDKTVDEENGEDNIATVGESQVVSAYRALEHESIVEIAAVAHELVKEAMNIGASARSPREVEECFRSMRRGDLPQEYINICNKVIAGEFSSVRETELDTQSLIDELGLSATPAGSVTVGEELPLNFEAHEISKTYSFDISDPGEYEITVIAELPHRGDPAIILTSTTDAGFLDASDDSGESYDSIMKSYLEVGHYELQVFNLGDGQGSFRLLIKKATE